MSDAAWLHRLEAILPGQAPLGDFVHHNTLHGLQHLPFPQALRTYRELTGAAGYLPEGRFRAFLQNGRITPDDLAAELHTTPGLNCAAALGPITRGAVYYAALVNDFSPLNAGQLAWEMEQGEGFQPTVSLAARQKMRADSPGKSDPEIVDALWRVCLTALGIPSPSDFHPEALTDLSPEAETVFVHQIPAAAARLSAELRNRIGRDLTLRGLLQALTGIDILDQARPHLVRYLAGFLDHGISAWPLPMREMGFYPAWKKSAAYDFGTPEWRTYLSSWPENAAAALDQAFAQLGLPETHREGYLERLALELPGWSGMMLWRHLHPNYQGLIPQQVNIQDYFAVRMIIERFYAQQLDAKQGFPPNLEALRAYFDRHPAELLARWTLFNSFIPDYLATRIQQLLPSWSGESADKEHDWQECAALILAWRASPAGEQNPSAHQHAWPLFLLAQHLGLTTSDIRSSDFAHELLATIGHLDTETRGDIWLRAYERHYQQQIFTKLTAKISPQARVNPMAQIVFCMDDREEGFRRHLEAINPQIETFGASGFFGIAMNWQGLDDAQVTRAGPVGIIPAHTVREIARPGGEAVARRRRQRRNLRITFQQWLWQRSFRGLLTPLIFSLCAAPMALVALIGKLFTPLRFAQFVTTAREIWDIPVATQINFIASESPISRAPFEGFSFAEQANRVAGLLRNIGLTRNFAPLVVIIGHGSTSQNNPHFAAYNCGACSGRPGGPNARIFAAMANRPEVRELLRADGIVIPDSCWFFGAEHNTASEAITWYDRDLLPVSHQTKFVQLGLDLARAQQNSAQERCQKFAAAPRNLNKTKALRHVMTRTVDFSQARPELGHATNATAIIGRRELTKGRFFDRRVYLISYDPRQDPEGKIIEGILVAVAPVGAGINLEYYFSTVNNDYFGCSSKVTHNLNGLFGVMDGANSDLRTGLPRQMIEIHEAMRLLVIVEQRPEILSLIYQRQPLLQELIGNTWIHLAVIEPESGILYKFFPGVGWLQLNSGAD